ncbi:MAG TPA: hypothetical protein VMV01_16230, partial [Planctomycetota bacterium]|nr:hypothetical protein [Planctomycetota bacterium]
VRPEEDAAAAGVWLGTLDGQRRRLVEGWFVSCAWSRVGDLLVSAGRPDLNGELWRVSREGRRDRVLASFPLTLRYPNELIGISRFDVHPDGTRVVLEAFESYEADISMIDNVR